MRLHVYLHTADASVAWLLQTDARYPIRCWLDHATLWWGLTAVFDLTRSLRLCGSKSALRHMLDRGVPERLVTLLSHWHHATHYNLTYRGNTVNIPIRVGVRQGCKAASPVMGAVHGLHAYTIGTPSLDLHGSARRSPCTQMTFTLDVNLTQFHSLDCHLRNIGHLLDVLETLKLRLSYPKSHVLISVAGSNSRNALKGRLTHKGDSRCILIPRAQGRQNASSVEFALQVPRCHHVISGI